MIVTTTPLLQGKEVREYLGIVNGEVIMGANIVRDFLSGITDIIGGRSGVYESKLQEGREEALRLMEEAAALRGADAVLGVDLDFEVIGANGSMLMIVATGTAVKLG
ncbi:YbjQ family protein [Brevibacillus dissolubilis]|uniref:YbjQ family protein n=1 Tax=Brevibacillus dissolubilis TaxID=1844116 RepID=UPI00111657C3|nr:YbjQ family protein [Brevibacillus dissolubilis]